VLHGGIHYLLPSITKLPIICSPPSQSCPLSAPLHHKAAHNPARMTSLLCHIHVECWFNVRGALWWHPLSAPLHHKAVHNPARMTSLLCHTHVECWFNVRGASWWHPLSAPLHHKAAHYLLPSITKLPIILQG
jgi:hypothetical protein